MAKRMTHMPDPSLATRCRIDNNRFTKLDPINQRLKVELLKTNAGRRLSLQSQLFNVPEVLAHSDSGVMYKYISGLVPLRGALHLMDSTSNLTLVRRVGSVLATIHDRLDIPYDLTITLPSPYADADVVAIHGDFGLTNVQYQPETDTIYVLDWSTPAWLGQWCTHGSSDWDVALFIGALYYQRPRDPAGIARPSLIAKSFLAGYKDVRPLPSDASLRATANLAAIRTAHGYGSRSYLRIPSLMRMAML